MSYGTYPYRPVVVLQTINSCSSSRTIFTRFSSQSYSPYGNYLYLDRPVPRFTSTPFLLSPLPSLFVTSPFFLNFPTLLSLFALSLPLPLCHRPPFLPFCPLPPSLPSPSLSALSPPLYPLPLLYAFSLHCSLFSPPLFLSPSFNFDC